MAPAGPRAWIDAYLDLLPHNIRATTLNSVDSLELTLRESESTPPTDLRCSLATRGIGFLDLPNEFGGKGLPLRCQLLVQFVAGYYDLDFRDVADLAHGRLILQMPRSELRREWGARIAKGEVLALAATEPNGGTSVLHSLETTSRMLADQVIVTGTKCWISRLEEANAFLVLHRGPEADQVGLTLVPAEAVGIKIELRRPTGLRGSSWGWLHLNHEGYSR